MATNNCCDVLCQAATPSTETANAVDQNNFAEILFKLLQKNHKSCQSYELSKQQFYFNNILSHLIIHLNISSLQAHFDELLELLSCFPNPPIIIFLSLTGINHKPHINIDIPGIPLFIFLHLLKLEVLVHIFPNI